MSEKKHVSEDEKRKSFLIFILLGILGAIILTTLVIIMIPKIKKMASKPKVQNTTKNVVKKVIESSSDKKKEVYKDMNKVNISIKQDTLTTDSAVIVITDTNENKFRWTQLYRIQQKIDDKWQDVKLISVDDILLSKEYYDNETGVMEQSLVWTEKYGSLGVGQYRIVKEAERMEFYVEFEIQ